MSSHCAGSSRSDGIVDAELTRDWKRVFRIFPECHADETLPLARTRRRNGDANERRAQLARISKRVMPRVSNEYFSPVEAAIKRRQVAYAS
jgi:hypothetical protein